MKIHVSITILLILFTFTVVGHLNAQKLSGEKVVGSSSRNHEYAIFCTADGVRDHFENFIFDVRNLRSKSNIRLVRTRDLNTSVGDEDSTRSLYESLGSNFLGTVHHEQVDPAFIYHVHWNSDATLLAVEGGEHKFWHCCIYRNTGNGFSEIRFDKEPAEKLVEFTKVSVPKIHNMGVNRFKKRYPYGEPYVHLLEDGYVAINTYPAQCSRDFHSLPEDQQERMQVGYDLYFLWHLDSTGIMKFVGFCR